MGAMPRADKLSLFVFVDAFGWRLIERYGFLDDELGFRAPLATVFGYSSTCVPTILTGCMPREHGHFSFFHYAPGTSPFRPYRLLRLLPRALADRGRVRRHLSRLVAARLGYTGYFQLYAVPFRYLPLFDYSEKRDLYQPGGIINGQPTLFDRLRDHGVPFFLSDWHADDDANVAALNAAIERDAPRFAWLALGRLDGVGHAEGPDGAGIAATLAGYEAHLRATLAAARRRYREVKLCVFSDHGMAAATATCDLIARVEATGLRFGVDYVAMYDATMARFWFLCPGARGRIVDALAAEPHGRILDDAGLAVWGCDFPDHKYGELFFLLEPGALICPSFMGVRPVAGMHGYAPEAPDSTAMIAAGAAPEPLPRRLDDLHDMMLRAAEA